MKDMMSFEREIINSTVEKLLKGEDYREEVVNAINISFLDFSLEFLQRIAQAKRDADSTDLEWYKKAFINNSRLKTDEIAIFSGMNKKTITNIYGTAGKETVVDVANTNFNYSAGLIGSLERNDSEEFGITVQIQDQNGPVSLSFTESLLVMNALATKKIAIRGGAWSSIGKKVEKPLVTKLCKLCKVPKEYIDASVFKKDGTLDFDREVDYKIYSRNKKPYRVEVKLMGKGNPESADATVARDTDLLIADTLSRQTKNQLASRNVEFLELKNNRKIIPEFKAILKRLDVPFLE